MSRFAPLFTAPVARMSALNIGTCEEEGVNASLLDQADREIQAKFPKMHSFLLLRHGKLIWERYYNGHEVSSLNDLRSATKSFTSTLIGIAMARGDMPGPETAVHKLLPEYLPRRKETLLEQITIRHLLTMTSGLYWQTGKKLGEAFIHRFHRSKSWPSFALRLPVQEDQLGVFQYRSVDSHLLSVLLTHCCGIDAYTYALQHLFEPLGFGRSGWAQDPEGYTMGHIGLYLTSRDMAKFGDCCLHQGSWNGTELIPADWLHQATQRQVEGYPEFGDYGFQWWTGRLHGINYACAHGHGGQQIYLVPEANAVAVFTADSKVSRWKNPRTLLERYVFPAVSSLNLERS
ncbi:serine hydrolase [Paenibacillus sp. MZ03-122A]|uniref:serine hydrolase domain-containing protein n=1 Tax=Paenibacillus sp. MZ03-122A TaxID=2962033 RepID=UPI0020B8110D|nr:serine hydrolase [Paenibacillus sp. MZ03-122A]MCP3779358.1 beta-lactamase family protein [Paenibacillus sp. MZ03-122A]